MEPIMSFRITGLPAEKFQPLFAMSDAELKRQGALRLKADGPGYPCRVSLTDAAPGDELILLHYEHQDADTPFRASHAIYVRPGEQRYESVAKVPAQLRKRLLSIRAYDQNGMMLEADVADGTAVEPVIARMFGNDKVSYLHVHYARQGCYAARVDRA
jgi:hypothetical protein